jgi:hypothetical protein
MLSGPVGFVLSMFYCWFLARALRRTERIRRVIRARKRMAEGMETAVRRLDRLRRLVFFGSLVVLAPHRPSYSRLISLAVYLRFKSAMTASVRSFRGSA